MGRARGVTHYLFAADFAMTEQQKREFYRELAHVFIASWWELDDAMNGVIAVLERHGFADRYLETQQAAKTMSDALDQIGQICSDAIETPNEMDDRQVPAQVLEIVRSLE